MSWLAWRWSYTVSECKREKMSSKRHMVVVSSLLSLTLSASLLFFPVFDLPMGLSLSKVRSFCSMGGGLSMADCGLTGLLHDSLLLVLGLSALSFVAGVYLLLRGKGSRPLVIPKSSDLQQQARPRPERVLGLLSVVFGAGAAVHLFRMGLESHAVLALLAGFSFYALIPFLRIPGMRRSRRAAKPDTRGI